ncbi:MAG: glycosyltransferase [Fimbriimonadaceae bacterium]|nr:glycosyltransferase [Fimbriimonadaceae bacterium]
MPKNKELSILYLGAFTPDRPEYKNSATSTAGNIFQLNFLAAFKPAGLPAPEVCSYRPMPSFPRSKKLFYLGGKDILSDGTQVRFLAFLNLGALKIITLGLSSCLQVIRWGLRNRASKRRVVIAYNLTAPPAWPIFWACRLVGCEFVPFIGDIYVPGEVVKDTWLRRREFAGQRRIIPKVDGLLVANQAIIEDFAQGRDALLIEGGVPSAFVQRFASRHKQDEDHFNIVFAGQLSELNGIPLIIEAMKRLQGDRYRLSIAGGGEYADAVKKAAEADPRITYHGLIPHHEVLALYAKADLLLSLRRTHYQTHRYVFPSKVVECLATGCPLLTTDTGHAREEFGSFVILLEDETPEAVADKIEEIATWSPDKRAKLGKAAQAYVKANRSWESNVKRLKDYLDQVAA